MPIDNPQGVSIPEPRIEKVLDYLACIWCMSFSNRFHLGSGTRATPADINLSLTGTSIIPFCAGWLTANGIVGNRER